ncbi:MAG: ATP-dependent sacrificial sulfur transferase LarE [Chloroflexi bacterium]|nr:ATP-dependent sacrificial sulfur transferase LarE [Chloroflexota bacterium]
MTLEEKQARLEGILREMGAVVVGYSGGVDSTFLTFAANRALGSKCLAVFGHSPTCPPEDFAGANFMAQKLALNYRVIETNELEDPQFVANDQNRCYYCKSELFQKLNEIAKAEGMDWVADGSNIDDLTDYRPGRRACSELNVRSPLLEAELSKEEIRQLSRENDLPTWDKPASPCLASRIPYGTPVTEDVVQKIAAGELYLRSLGIRTLRLRHHGDIARIEIEEKDMGRVLDDETRREIVRRLKTIGYLYVTLDLTGYRTGSLNAQIGQGAASTLPKSLS